jgi:hypothetical protein
VLVLPHATYTSAGCICFGKCMSCRRELVFHQSHVCVSMVHVLLYVPVLHICACAPAHLHTLLRDAYDSPCVCPSDQCLCCHTLRIFQQGAYAPVRACLAGGSLCFINHTYASVRCMCFCMCLSFTSVLARQHTCIRFCGMHMIQRVCALQISACAATRHVYFSRVHMLQYVHVLQEGACVSSITRMRQYGACASVCACPSHLCLRASTPAYASAGCI